MSNSKVIVDTTKVNVSEGLGISEDRKEQIKEFLTKEANRESPLEMINSILATDMPANEKIYGVFIVGIGHKINIDNVAKEITTIGNYIR